MAYDDTFCNAADCRFAQGWLGPVSNVCRGGGKIIVMPLYGDRHIFFNYFRLLPLNDTLFFSYILPSIAMHFRCPFLSNHLMSRLMSEIDNATPGYSADLFFTSLSPAVCLHPALWMVDHTTSITFRYLSSFLHRYQITWLGDRGICMWKIVRSCYAAEPGW